MVLRHKQTRRDLTTSLLKSSMSRHKKGHMSMYGDATHHQVKTIKPVREIHTLGNLAEWVSPP